MHTEPDGGLSGPVLTEERDDENLELGSWKLPKTRRQETGNLDLVLAGSRGPEKIMPLLFLRYSVCSEFVSLVAEPLSRASISCAF